MTAVEIVIFRLPLPGETRAMDWACQIRKVGEQDGKPFYSGPETLPPGELAKLGITLESVIGQIATEAVARAETAEQRNVALEADLDKERQEKAALEKQVRDMSIHNAVLTQNLVAVSEKDKV